MIIYLYGSEHALLLQEKQRLVREFQKKYPQATTLVFDVEDAGDSVFDQYRSQSQPGLFEAKKLIVLLNPGALDAAKTKKLISFLEVQAENPDIVHIVVDPRKAKKSDALQKALVKLAQTTKEFSTVTERDYTALIRNIESEYERTGDLEKAAERALRERTGTDMERLQSELAKLFLYKPTGKITLEDVEALVQKAMEIKVFDALDSLASEQKENALRQFRALLNESDIYQLVGMCAWQLRRMIQVAALAETGQTNSAAIAKETGLPPFVVQKMLRYSNQFTTKRLVRGMKLLSDLDVDLKQGKRDGQGVIEAFVFGL